MVDVYFALHFIVQFIDKPLEFKFPLVVRVLLNEIFCLFVSLEIVLLFNHIFACFVFSEKDLKETRENIQKESHNGLRNIGENKEKIRIEFVNQRFKLHFYWISVLSDPTEQA